VKQNNGIMQTWSAVNKCGQVLTIRLTNKGELERKFCGQQIWQQIAQVDLSMSTVKDVRDTLEHDENIRKVVSQKA